MYEQTEVPVLRRILWIALWFVVIVAVLWVLVWLIFFRHSAPKKPALSGSKATTSQSAGSSHTKSTGSGSTATGTTGNSSGNTSGSSNTPAPAGSTPAPANTPAPSNSGQLVNTGAGDVFVPFAVAALTGSTLYYVRTAKKLRAE